MGFSVTAAAGDDRGAVQVALARQRRLRGLVVASADPLLQDVDRGDARAR